MTSLVRLDSHTLVARRFLLTSPHLMKILGMLMDVVSGLLEQKYLSRLRVSIFPDDQKWASTIADLAVERRIWARPLTGFGRMFRTRVGERVSYVFFFVAPEGGWDLICQCQKFISFRLSFHVDHNPYHFFVCVCSRDTVSDRAARWCWEGEIE